MLAQFDVNLVVLLVLLICGLLSQNAAVTIAAGILIVIKITPLNQFFLIFRPMPKLRHTYSNNWRTHPYCKWQA
jgi:hypothetical protein